MKVLFIASNIPTPTQRNNSIILTIAKELSSRCKINIMYPKPIVPFFLRLFGKHKNVFSGKSWENEGNIILTQKYLRLPVVGFSFKLFERNLIRKDIQFHDSVLPDLIHAHYVFADGSLALLINKKYKIPFVVTVRGYDARKILELRTTSFDYSHAREVLQRASKVFCLNHFQKEVIESRFNISVEVLPHGIENSQIINPKIDSSNTKIKIVVVGELIEQKNIFWVINAINEYQGNIDVQLDIYGDGPLRNVYEKFCKNINRINIRGKVSRDEILNALSESQVFCLPSENETFGLVFLEAAAKANAMIGRYKDGIWEVFEDKSEMLYAKNEIDFTQHLYKIIEDVDLRNSMMTNANKRVKTYSWSRIIDRYMHNYESILKSIHG